MKCLIILGILSLIELPFVDSNECECNEFPTKCSDVHKCVNCKLVDYHCKVRRYGIATENECLNLLTNSSSYNGIEWKSDFSTAPCRTIDCTDVHIRQNDNSNECRTIYWKTCNAGCRTSVFIESITDLPIPMATPSKWPVQDSAECFQKCFPPSQNCTAIYKNNNCDVYLGYNTLGSVQTVAAGSTASTLICTEMVCSCLPNPNDGYVNASAIIHVGTTAIYSCRAGYALSGSSTLTCGADGNWSASPPTCRYIDCGAPIAPANGYVNFTSTTLTSQAYYSCDEGFDLDGITYTTCESNGNWSDSQVMCFIKNCNAPNPPLNGSVNYTSTTYKSQAIYSCDEGFDLKGPSFTTCGANGNWNDLLPSCLIKDCPAPFPPLNGSVDYTSTTYKSQATYRCDSGFDLKGSTYITCGANGNWNDQYPTCTIRDCHAPIQPANGSVNFSSTTYNSQAIYSCDEGFILDGSTNTTCEANGNWSNSLVVCLIKDCRAPIPPFNGNVNYTSTTFKSQANYSCDEGFDLHGITNITCEANGNWSDSQVECLIKNCHAPIPPSNGTVNYTSTTFNSQANYDCDEGFNLDGSTSTTCEANGNWSDLQVVCLVKDCGAPIPPLNGSVNYTSTTFKSQANFSCDEGFDLSGSTNATCEANGNWSDLFLSCLIKDCLAPFPPLNGSVNYTSTTYNSQTTYSCEKGFDLNGSTHTTCGANGNWSDPFPTCTIKDCRAPIPSVNGSVNFTSTTYNSQAIYSCDQGYHHGGSTTTTCGDNGNWTNTPPNCTIIDCKEPSQVINGDVVFNETTYGKQALYSCHQGYSIQGPKTLTCQVNGLWVPDKKPSCLAPGSKKKPLYIVPCNCCPNKTFTNMTQDEILVHLVNETRIDTKNTSAALDKLRSRSDSRTSSAVIGTVAIVILSTLAGLIVCSDLITICKKRNARRKSE